MTRAVTFRDRTGRKEGELQTIGEAVAEQFDRMWMMLEEAITNCPDEEWKRDSGNWFLVPSRLAYHTIETVDYYSRQSPEGMEWAQRFGGVDWETKETDGLPDRESVSAYLKEARGALEAKLLALSDEDLLSGHAFPWTGATVLDRMIYALRHSMFHLGQIQAELRRRGLEGAQWH
jgi:uncharacterized damage-inducible protein DinB